MKTSLSFSKELRAFCEKYSGDATKMLNTEFKIEKELLCKKVFGKDMPVDALFNYKTERGNENETELERDSEDIGD